MSIGICCGNADTEALTLFARSLGLHLFPILFDDEVSVDPGDGPFCWLSLVPKSQLHPHGNPAKISYVDDPLIGFGRAYYKSPYLVAGEIQWYWDYGRPVATKPAYQALAKWIRSEWKMHRRHGFYFGPEAQQLLVQGAQVVNFPPESEVRKKKLN